MSRPLRLAERGSHGARVLGLRERDTTFEPRGRKEIPPVSCAGPSRYRGHERRIFFRKQGGTVERCRFTPECQVGGEAFFFTPKKSEGDKNHGRKQ